MKIRKSMQRAGGRMLPAEWSTQDDGQAGSPNGLQSGHSRRPRADVKARGVWIAAACALLGLSLLAAPARAVETQRLHGHLFPELAKLQAVGRLSASTQLNLAIGLPLRNKEALTSLLQLIYDPASPDYQHYLTSDQFAEQFGPTEKDYQAVMDFAQANGFRVTGMHPNRVVLDVSGSVADIERTFHLTMRVYHHPTEPRTFFAPDAEPSLDLATPVLEIYGLNDFMPPRPMSLRRAPEDQKSGIKAFATGSGSGGDYLGGDFRAAYAPGVTLTGVGQTIGLFEFGEYFTSDIILYQQTAGLSSNIVVTNILLDGFTGIPAPGTDDGEEALDIDMAMCMAPGASIYVYEGNSALDILNRMATDNKAKQMSCSFGFYPPPSTMDTVLMQFAAQGQAMFVAAGDGGAYNSSQTIFAPADDPNITSVGGTSLTTSGARGPWLSETTWIGSGGGITPHYSIPSWQVGMNMSTNHGSTVQRNFPDVSILADTVIFWYLKDGESGTVGGTSAAAPLWAGFMALVNQQALANGRSSIGFFNPVLYEIGKSNANYTTLMHDITTGSNTNSGSPTNFFAIPGYDLATGWGSPNGSNLINLLAAPLDSLNITPGIGFALTAPFGIPFNAAAANFSLTNAGAALVNWSVGNTSVWLNVSSTSGTLPAASPATTVTVNLNTAAVSDLASGIYYATVWITNVTSGVVQSRLFSLNVSPANFPIAVSGFNAGVIVPANATTSNKGASGFDLANNISFYQAGLNANPQVSGSGGTQGLPTNGLFASQLDGVTMFQLGPAGSATNVLLMGDTYVSSGTLTLANPQSYNSLAILASSANGGGNGTLVIHFTNGTTSQTFNFNAQDWFNTTTNVALQGFGRLDLNSGLFTENNGGSNPNLYQTTINLAAFGLNQAVSSITFTKPSITGSQDSGVFAISGALMPPQAAIGAQPLSTTNNVVGSSSTFSVAAMGTPPLAYQWYSPTGAVSGALSSALTLLNVQSAQAGSYYVVVSNAFNSVTSAIATLTVFRAPVITQQPNPTSLVLFMGETNVFFVAGNGAQPLSYYWNFNGTPIAGATSSTYTINNLQLPSSGNYTAILSNSVGAATSSVVSLTVVPIPISPYAQAVLADHPIAYWRLDETNGTVAHDYIGGNNGIYNSVTLDQPGHNPADPDPAVKFGPGTGSYVGSIPIDFSTTGNGELSVEAWVKGVAQTTDAGLMAKGTGGGGEQFDLDCGSGNHAFRFFVRDDGGGAHLANGTIAPDGNWHHLVGVCDEANGIVVLYVDGVSNASGTITAGSGIQSSANAVSIGSRQSGTTLYDDQFIGSMDEAAIYNYPLTAAQVAAHYAQRNTWPPAFTSNPIIKPNANAGQPYSGTIATNASDPDGDTLTFTKLSGAAWLNVAANGALSGTPTAANFGTNSFIVRVTDPGGLSNNATMFIYVNIPPSFLSNPFAEPSVNAGTAYSGTIATNATDPNAGGTLTFALVSGPGWLSVAGNGALSGTPANSNANTNTFVVSAMDSGGLSSNATMYIYVNGAPVFTTNPFSEPAATVGQPYAGSIAGAATDPNPGDILTFALVSGPAWLSVAGNGTLSGTPLAANVGTNSFVVSATDPGGLSATATMNLAVDAGSAINVTISLQGTNLVLNWTGGNPPYQVQTTTDLVNGPWQGIGGPISSNTISLTPSNAAAFYRISGQ
jgi:Pro-kumamolisin, activation domain/Concanavalin A-like lectin/glucanases superfamily/Putative Ig domain/Viral BACON domain